LAALGDLSGKSHTKAVCDLGAHKVFGRYLRELKSGALKLDKAKIDAEAKVDGKYLISTSDEHLSVEDVLLGKWGEVVAPVRVPGSGVLACW